MLPVLDPSQFGSVTQVSGAPPFPPHGGAPCSPPNTDTEVHR